MDDAKKQKAAITVGSKVRLRDGREGNVTAISDNQITVTTGDGNTIVEAPITDVEPIDTEGEATS